MKLYYHRGATAYEFQLNRLWVQLIYYSGTKWYRRLSIKWITDYDFPHYVTLL